MRYLVTLVLFLTMLTACSTTSGFSESSQSQFVHRVAKRHPDFTEAQVKDIISQAKFQPKIIDAISAPAEAKPWYQYRQLLVNPARVNAGKDFYKQHQQILQQAQKTYGVPSSIVMAIVGIETNYGRRQGSFKVLDALSTLSFAYPRRAAFFQSELENYLVMIKKNGWPATKLTGSYAGAFGMGQFMPSSYLRYAVSADPSKGKAPDLTNNANDALLSVANYFKANGWQTGDRVAIPVKLSDTADFESLKLNSLKPNYTVGVLKHHGVIVPANINNDIEASLILLENANNQKEAWLTFHNFYVISRYNPHVNYAMAVFQLSQQLPQ